MVNANWLLNSQGCAHTHPQHLTISPKWDIFHYVYGLLHHPEYRERYQANLKRELPRIPLCIADDADLITDDTQDTNDAGSTDSIREIRVIRQIRDCFWKFAEAGQRLSEIHVGYEDMPEYPLTFIETPDMPLDWRVEKMRLSKDKTQIVYNDFLTLDGIPPEALALSARESVSVGMDHRSIPRQGRQTKWHHQRSEPRR